MGAQSDSQMGAHSQESPYPLPGRERERNPFLRSATGVRVLSRLQRPFFALLPPPGFGVLTTTGRKTGKARQTPVRTIRRGQQAYLVAIGGERNAWLENTRANPNVRLRIRGGTFSGVTRELRDEAEARDAKHIARRSTGSTTSNARFGEKGARRARRSRNSTAPGSSRECQL